MPQKKTKKKMKKKTNRLIVRKKSKKKLSKKKTPHLSRREKPIGTVTHFFRKAKVGVVRFRVPVKTGLMVRFRGATTNFTQKLSSMQYNHKPLARVPKGKEIGVRIVKRVRGGDMVYFEG